MEMPGQRSSYALLNQFPDEQRGSTPPPPYYDSSVSSESKNSKFKSERGFDWELDHRPNQQCNRIGNLNLYSSSAGLQQSSGSSFEESSLSGECYPLTLSTAGGNEIEAYGGSMHEDGSLARATEVDVTTVSCTGYSGKSWARQTEESYQLQLALLLSLSSAATCADDPNFLDLVPDECTLRSSSSNSPEVLSHRFWVNGCLSYYDKIPDGFYIIHGMDPYVWTVCTDLQESSHIPSIDSLKSVNASDNPSFEVVLIDQHSDPGLKELQTRVHNISSSCITTEEVADQLAKLVCNRMGGSASMEEDGLISIWKECSHDLKDCLGSSVVPICSLSVGLCRHRALLFKVLADTIDLPCRIAKGCRYCRRNEATSCLVRFGFDREYLIDLVGKPGCLCKPNSLLNGPSSISVSSPLRFPWMKSAEPGIDYRSLAKEYFSDAQLLNLVFDDTSAGDASIGAATEEESGISTHPQQIDQSGHCRSNVVMSELPLQMRASHTSVQQRDTQLSRPYNPSKNAKKLPGMVKEQTPVKHIPPTGHRDVQPLLSLCDQMVNTAKDSRFFDSRQLVSSKASKELSLDVEDVDIPWSDLILKEKIGAGSFGTVHRAEWHGSDVAVKILMEQDFHAEHVKEFLREVSIMKRLRHPNIVLFMGAVTHPPYLSIVTEYLSRGSLFRLLHKPSATEVLDGRRRLNMAYDVAKGMNYLHKRSPPIVHRDLKSPNLLVDRNYTVKVCDFGLSRLKANTFLSSKSAAGTPEWMAPEVLRDEPSNEKADVYSFGVILWELATLQQPWSNLNPAQVVAAVGFKGKRLEIPPDVNPQVAGLIEACWGNEPWKRPSFASIMESLRPLI
ncbi:hypothetical protein K2173_018561 [Erythroxylum novogranatense]|uniref:non-specific serine/threonine protein kinase n=1 Tax=Erythroxylum novogranatense TaxID=1862640 RepID=A0AAV8UEE8_9ROSI|nr:hypothetical protein K2173_018561 [Erythroxylum novogranatense]